MPVFEVTVCVDGEPLREYDYDEEEEVPGNDVAQCKAARTTTKYVESVSGKGFCGIATLNKGFNMGYDSIRMRLHIDGQYMTGAALRKAVNMKRYLE